MHAYLIYVINELILADSIHHVMSRNMQIFIPFPYNKKNIPIFFVFFFLIIFLQGQGNVRNTVAMLIQPKKSSFTQY